MFKQHLRLTENTLSDVFSGWDRKVACMRNATQDWMTHKAVNKENDFHIENVVYVCMCACVYVRVCA